MQIDIVFETPTLDDMKERLNLHFKQTMKVYPEKMSIFEQYQIRFTKKFIPKIWTYRIICKNNKYYFGIIKDGI